MRDLVSRMLVVGLLAGLAAVSGPPALAEQEQSAQRPVAAASIAAGAAHSCALMVTGAVRCWGDGSFGQLGYGATPPIGSDPETPASAGDVPLGGTAIAVAAGRQHSCALLTTGAVRCWGDGGFGQLGYASTESIGDTETPASAGDVPLGARATAITAGAFHTCALLTTGGVRCWGDGGFGRLGYGNTDNIGDDETPASAGDVTVGGRAVAVSAGGTHTCAVLTTGGVRCWGESNLGRLGYGATGPVGDDEAPASAGDVPLGGRAVAISAGDDHTCVVLTTGAVRCWGAGDGRLGYGNTSTIGDDETPASAGDVPVGGRAAAVSAAGFHTCVALSTGGVRCWGVGNSGQLGYGNTNTVGDDELPASAGDVLVGARVATVSTGGAHTCAVLTTGGLRCWGAGSDGRLGYGHTRRIGDDETPASAGNVLVGARIRVVAPTGLRIRVGPARDRRAPFRFQLTGRILTPYAGPEVCRGRVSVVVRRATRPRTRVLVRSVGLRADCTFSARLALTSSRVPLTGKQKAAIRKVHNSNRPARRKRQLIAAIRRTPLVVTVTLPATTNLAVAATRRKVVVR